MTGLTEELGGLENLGDSADWRRRGGQGGSGALNVGGEEGEWEGGIKMTRGGRGRGGGGRETWGCCGLLVAGAIGVD